MAKAPRRFRRFDCDSSRPEWRLLSPHGVLLFFVAVHPGATVLDMSVALDVSRSSAWQLADDLCRSGALDVCREGRENRYAVNLDARIPFPGLADISLRNILAGTAGAGVFEEW